MKLNELIEAEPVRFAAFTQAVLALGVAFGLGLSGVQVAAIMAAEAAGMSFFLRRSVTPL